MKMITAAGAAALALFAAAPTQAEAPAGAPNDLSLSLGYDGKLYVKILNVELEHSAGRRGFQNQMRVLAIGPLAVFKKLDVRASSRGSVDRGTARPSTFNYVSKSGKKERTLTADWTGKDVETNASPAFASMGDPPATRGQRIEGADPLTALLRMSMADEPCAGSSRIYDGKQRYNLNMSRLGAGKLDDAQKALGLRNPIRCKAHYQKVAGFKANKTEAEKDAVTLKDMDMAFAQVGEDGPWVVTEMSVDTGIGAMKLRLARMKTGAGAGAGLARLKSSDPG